MGLVSFASLFDPTDVFNNLWNRYTTERDPSIFIKCLSERVTFWHLHDWFKTKIFIDSRSSAPPVDTELFEKLIATISKHDTGAGTRCTQLFIAFLSHRQKPQSQIPSTGHKRAFEAVDFLTLWERFQDQRIQPEKLLPFGQEGEVTHFALFSKWLDENIHSDRNLAILEQRAKQIGLLNKTYGDILTSIINIKRLFLPHERGEAKRSLDFIMHGSLQDYPLTLLEALAKIPAKMRLEVCQFATSHSFDSYGLTQRIKILSSISKVKSSERDDIYKQAESFVSRVLSVRATNHMCQLAPIIDAFANMHPIARAGAPEFALEFCKGLEQDDSAEILTAFGKVHPDEMQEVADSLKQLSPPCKSGLYVADLIDTIASIKKGQRAECCRLAKPFCQEDGRDIDCSSILREIAHTTPSERKIVSEYALKFNAVGKRFENDGPADIIQACREIDPERLPTVYSTFMLLWGNKGVGDRTIAIRCLGHADVEKMPELAQELLPHLEREGLFSVNLRAHVLYAASLIAPSERTKECLNREEFRCHLSFLNLKCFDILEEFEQTDFIAATSLLLPPELRYKALTTLRALLEEARQQDEFDEPAHRLFDLVLAQDPSDRATIQKYLEEMLMKEMTDQRKAYLRSRLLIQYKDALGLFEEHPLFERAIILSLLTDPTALQNRKNPYRFYNDLKEILRDEKPLKIELQPITIAGEIISLKLETFRERAKCHFCIKDLPAGIDPDTLEHLFDALEKRVEALPEEERTAAESERSKHTRLSFTQARSNLVSQPLIQRFMHIQGPKEMPIENSIFYLHIIVKALIEQSNEIENGEHLSAQEIFLLRMAGLIAHCATGQRDGISEFYHTKLPVKYRVQGLSFESAREEQARRLVDLLVQEILHSVLASPEFLQKVANLTEVAQGSHLTQALCNRHHLQIGLQHTLLFDQQSGVIHDAILDAPCEKVIRLTYEMAAPEFLPRLKKSVEESLKIDKGLFLALQELLELQGVIHGHNWLQRFITFNDTLTPTGLTDEGAKAVFKAIGYFS